MSTFAIDTRGLTDRKSGIGYYTACLARTMANLRPEDDFIAWGKPVERAPRNLARRSFGGKWQYGWEMLWEKGFPVGPDLIGPKPDLWHFPHFAMAPTRRPAVITVYDLVWQLHPEFMDETNRRWIERTMPRSIERAEAIIAISESTKAGLVSEFGIDPKKVTVTHLAGQRDFRQRVPATARRTILKRLKVESPYILAVGNLEPRKNLATLFRAFAKIRNRTKADIVVAGSPGWLFEETEALLGKLGIGDRVRFTGYVSDRQLVALYQSAELFAFPSLYEGFGIPVVEAMQAGVPVISSNTSSLPEVGGTAVRYANPNRPGQWSEAIEQLLGNRATRAKLIQAGRKQAAWFSWEKTAKQTLAVYESLVH